MSDFTAFTVFIILAFICFIVLAVLILYVVNAFLELLPEDSNTTDECSDTSNSEPSYYEAIEIAKNGRDRRRLIQVSKKWGGYPDIVIHLASNPFTPEHTILALYKSLSSDPYYSVCSALLKHKAIPVDILKKEATSSLNGKKAGVAANPNTPSEIISILINDYDADVRRSLIKNSNPDISKFVEGYLWNDKSYKVREEVAKRTSDPNIQTKLAVDRNVYVRWYLADNPSLTAHVERKLAKDVDADVREEIAKRTSDPNIHTKLALDRDADVRIEVAKRTSDANILTKLAKDHCRNVRLEVAKNKHTLAVDLKTLQHDPHPDVRRAATQAIKEYNTRHKEPSVVPELLSGE